MRMSILTTATTEQMGYGTFSFFVYTKSIYESLCNLNMIVDIFTLSLNVSIYNEGNVPDEILIHRRDLCQRTYIKRRICLLFN